jgi:hypothetical protein
MTDYRRNFIAGGMVKLGVYPEDWAGDVSHDGASFGERR